MRGGLQVPEGGNMCINTAGIQKGKVLRMRELFLQNEVLCIFC